MPVIIHIAANLAFGAATAIVVRRSAAMRETFLNWSSLWLIAFEAILVTPITTYQFRFYPHWSMLYMFDPQMFPRLEEWIGELSLACVLLNISAALLGYALARYGILKEKPAAAWGVLLIGVATIVTVCILLPKRVALIGDYDGFWAGQGTLFILKVPGLIGIGLYAAGGLFLSVLHKYFRERDPQLLH